MAVNPKKYENFGLSTEDALQKLYDDILDVLQESEQVIINET